MIHRSVLLKRWMGAQSCSMIHRSRQAGLRLSEPRRTSLRNVSPRASNCAERQCPSIGCCIHERQCPSRHGRAGGDSDVRGTSVLIKIILCSPGSPRGTHLLPPPRHPREEIRMLGRATRRGHRLRLELRLVSPLCRRWRPTHTPPTPFRSLHSGGD